MNLGDLPSGKPFSEMTVEEQKDYWAHAAEYCRGIVRAEHPTRTPGSLQRVLESIARAAALADDPTGARRVDFLERLDVPSVEAVLAEPVRPCHFRGAAAQLTP